MVTPIRCPKCTHYLGDVEGDGRGSILCHNKRHGRIRVRYVVVDSDIGVSAREEPRRAV